MGWFLGKQLVFDWLNQLVNYREKSALL